MALAAGCATTVAYVPPDPLPNEPVPQQIRAYPPAMQLAHRGLLNVRGREFDLDGYLLYDASSGYRLLVASNFGGTLFELARIGVNPPEILRNPGPLRDGWIQKGPARDLEILFFTRPSNDAQAGVRPDGSRTFVDVNHDGVTEEFQFDASNNIVRYIEAKNGRVRREVVFENYRRTETWPEDVPQTIRIYNHRMHYTVTLQIVLLRPAESVELEVQD